MELYGFQQETLDKFKGKKVALIADDMGLGKTVQAIMLDKQKRADDDAIVRTRPVDGSDRNLTLVIAPLSVHHSWEKHFKEWQPDLEVVTVDPKARPVFILAATQKLADVFILHWEALRLMPELAKVHWFHIIADECHRMKNRKAQQTVALRKLRTTHKTAMSGTPADNQPQDFWSVLHWLQPREFSSYWAFFDYYVIQKTHNVGTCMAEDCGKFHKTAFKETLGCHDAAGLQKKISPFFIRRTKRQVLKDLPDKYYTTIEVDLHPQQRRAYDQMRDHMLAWIGEHEHEPLAAPVVISQLVRLQQFAVAYGEIVERKVMKEGEEVLAKFLKLTEPSAKLDTLMDIIGDNPNEQFVVFGQSKQVINMFGDRLLAKGIRCGLLTGDTKQADRGSLVEEFQRGSLRVFAGTISAGGVGITLTAASTVVFLDRGWSPSVNQQAEDRLHRIGQRNAVQVIDLVARDTLDRGRNQKIADKWEVLRELLGDKDKKEKLGVR